MRSVGIFLLINDRPTKRRLMIHIMRSVGIFLLINDRPTKRRLVVKRDPYHEVSWNFLLIIDRPTKRRLVVKRDPYHEVSRKFFVNYCKGSEKTSFDDWNIS
jgi:hypothetical protein